MGEKSLAAWRFAEKAVPRFWWMAAFSGAAGLYAALFAVPSDARHGDIFRIIFLHVPASWMSLFIYLCMAFWAGWGLFSAKRGCFSDSCLSYAMSSALTPTGALFTFLSLWTGALWGKPSWGAWWVWWDARLVSELILLFMYAGIISLRSAIDDPRRADKAVALLTLVGSVNIPVVYFSVHWWTTLHQGYSITLTRPPAMAPAAFWTLLLCVFACAMYTAAVSLMRFGNLLLERAGMAGWPRGAIPAAENG